MPIVYNQILNSDKNQGVTFCRLLIEYYSLFCLLKKHTTLPTN